MVGHSFPALVDTFILKISKIKEPNDCVVGFFDFSL